VQNPEAFLWIYAEKLTENKEKTARLRYNPLLVIII